MNLVKRRLLKNTLTSALAVLTGACLAQAQSPGNVTASIPYIAFGGVTAPNNVNAWTTEFIFTNLGTGQATVTFRWYGDSGAPLSVPVTGSGRAVTHQFQIAPNGTLDFSLDNTQDPLTGGWAAVDIVGSVSGQAVYHSDVTGRPEYSAAAPLVRNGTQANLILLGGGVPVSTVPAPVSLALPFNNIDNITGVSFANVTSTAQTLTLNFLDDGGALLMSQTIPLAAGAHTAFPASDPRVANEKGTITVSGDGSPYSAIAFVMGTGPNNGTIATLLPIVQ